MSIARYLSVAACPVSRSSSCGGSTALGQAQGAAAVQVHQVGEPFGAGPGDLAGLRVRAVGGGAAAELIDPGGLDRALLFVQAGELLIGVGGEGAGGGPVRDAVTARRRRGRHQVIADGLAEPGPQPGGQPGPGLDGGQPLGESPRPQPGAPQCQRVLRQSSRTCRSPMNTSRGAVRGAP